MRISDATFYNWKKKDSRLGPPELRRLKQLEEENAKLKRFGASFRQLCVLRADGIDPLKKRGCPGG